MQEILLTQGQVALVDDIDYEGLSKYKWRVQKHRDGNFYAIRNSKSKNGSWEKILMHRQILGLKYGDPRQGDHKNHNTLDNSRSNLRICTSRQNAFNRRKKPKTSKYKGVSWCSRTEKWMAGIQFNGKQMFLGRFRFEGLAALAYDFAAMKYFRDFAKFNF